MGANDYPEYIGDDECPCCKAELDWTDDDRDFSSDGITTIGTGECKKCGLTIRGEFYKRIDLSDWGDYSRHDVIRDGVIKDDDGFVVYPFDERAKNKKECCEAHVGLFVEG